ncbi:MAG: hypothetical protein HYW65_04475 [Candidatus Liptonbacteria bacterium]|nr:hypothetical protein [Candidatus Liptonbacteria bacterium]
MGTLRTEERERIYTAYRNRGELAGECKLCNKPPLQSFRFWKIAENSFPYDKIAEAHHMIISFRHVTESGLNAKELKEIGELKTGYINKNYDFVMEPTQKNKTIPEHFHLHLIVAKN